MLGEKLELSLCRGLLFVGMGGFIGQIMISEIDSLHSAQFLHDESPL